MIVCVCRRLSHRDIESQASECDSFDELQMNTGIATACGRCTDCAQAVFRQAQQASPCISRGALGDDRQRAIA
jgi:bacterioferritin-associated ferredoxin